MFNEIEIEEENAQERIRCAGPGAEVIRQRKLSNLQARMPAFYAHASMADIDALDMALELRENVDGSGGQATLVEAFIELTSSPLGHSCKRRRTNKSLYDQRYLRNKTT